MIEVIGWTAAILFAVCGLPQAWQCYKQGHGEGLSKTFLWTWFMGEALMLIYNIFHLGGDMPIMTNLIVNMFFILVMFRYVYFPKKKEVTNG